MTRLLPRSLFGQTLAILLLGLLVSHAVGSWLYTADREEAVRAVGGLAAAQRIANVTRLIDEAPREWRGRIVSGLSDQAFLVTLAAQAPAASDGAGETSAAAAIRNFLAAQLPSGETRVPQVAVEGGDGPPWDFGQGWGPGWGPGRHGMGGRGAMIHGPGPPGLRNLRVAMPLRDGGWLTFASALPESGPSFSRQFTIAMIVMALIIIAVSVWAVRRMTRPLASLAFAAERLGRDGSAPPLPETGTIETVQAARAFNAMQVRLRALIDNRTRLFAAVSHDLRTPLTLLRLRAENVENREERDKMVATIAEMDAMIGAALSYARDDASGEPSRPTDVAALVQSIVDDLAAAGMPVTLEAPASGAVCDCRPPALKRALVNLIDNAVKYGKAARVAVASGEKGVKITIDDDGPGIPATELLRVFEPFYRIEGSRSRETGGVGLGLAIAKSIVDAHGGTLTLTNREGGGLQAALTLPQS